MDALMGSRILRRLAAVLALIAYLSQTAFAAEVELAGRVVDTANLPIENARVYWVIDPTLSTPTESLRTIDGHTDSNGEFRLHILNHPATPGQITGQLWVHSPDHRISVVPAETLRRHQGANRLTRIVLQPPEASSFRIVDPEGRILEGQLVEPRYMEAAGPDTIPHALSQALGQISDADGLVTFRSISPKELEQVRIVSEKYGIQLQMCDLLKEPKTRTIQLQNAVRIPGIISVAANEQWDSRVSVVITSQLREAVRRGVSTSGLSGTTHSYVSVTPDEHRRFAVDTIADGILRYYVRTPADARYLPDLAQGNTTDVRPTEIRVKLLPTVQVVGTVVSAGTKTPVEGATVFLDTGTVQMTTTTDATGRFFARVLPGPLNVSAPCRTAYGDIRMPNQTVRTKIDAASSGPVTLNPIETPQLREISGAAVNSTGGKLTAASLAVYSEEALIGYGYVDAESRFQLFTLQRPHLTRINLFLDGRARSCNLVEEPMPRLTLE